MKICCSKNELLRSINIVLKAVPSKTTMPILECILIDAQSDVIRFTANDMDLGIETKVSGLIEETGRLAVEAKMLSEIVRKLPDSAVTIASDKNYTVTITCEKAKFVISGKSDDDFSYLPAVEREDSVEISQFTLKNLINQTIFSIAANENNKMMSGELFEIRSGYLRVVSLDGHRISIRRVELRESCPDRKVIVPGKTLQEISKILSGEMDDMIRLSFARNHLVFEMEGTTVVSRLIEGEYFSIDQMISTDYETKLVVNKREFLSCIDRATLFVREGDKKPIILDIRDDELTLSIDSPLGSMNEELAIMKEGKDLMIGFNPRFLIDALRVIDEEEVTLYMVNPKAPCFIRDEDETYTYLILPVNFTR